MSGEMSCTIFSMSCIVWDDQACDGTRTVKFRFRLLWHSTILLNPTHKSGIAHLQFFKMHPQLTDKKIGQSQGCLYLAISVLIIPVRIVCKEFIRALEECHSDFWAKYTGGCNGIKNELNLCLRKEVRGYSLQVTGNLGQLIIYHHSENRPHDS